MANSRFLSFYETELGPLKRQGQQYVVLCPFHSDNTPSLSIDPHKGLFHCFGCDQGGDSFAFYRLRHPGSSFSEAKEALARYGIRPLRERDSISEPVQKEEKPDIPECQLESYARCLTDTHIQYLKEVRGLTAEIIHKYRIGWHKERNRFTLPVMQTGNCVNVRLYDPASKKFKMLPISSGRGVQLYPEDQLENEAVVLCEGEWDALCAISNGIPAITSTGGVQTWKSEWSGKFTRKTVNICFDCQDVSRKAAVKRATELLPFVEKVRVIDLGLEDKEDVADYFVKYGKTRDDLLKLIEKTPAFKAPSIQVVTAEGTSSKMLGATDQAELDRLLEKAIPDRGFLRDYVDIFSEITDTAEAFLFWGAMVTLSTILGKNIWIPWEARKLYPNIWCIFLAPSGFRKGTALDIPTLLLRKVDKSLLLPQVASEEGLTKVLGSHRGQDTGFVRWQEFSKILRSWTKKQSWQASQEFWIDLWDNKPLKKTLAKEDFDIPTTSISFLSACTPTTFSRFFTSEDLEGGFFGRVYLVTCLEKKKYFPIPPSIQDATLNDLVKRLHDIKKNCTKQQFSYEGVERKFSSWAANVQEKHERSFLDSFYARIETHAMKLSMLYQAALTQKVEIREESFDYAVRALEFLIASATPLVSDEIGITEDERLIKRVYAFIQNRQTVNRRDVMRKFHLTSFDTNRIEETLVDRGMIDISEDERDTSKRGRRKRVYSVTKSN